MKRRGLDYATISQRNPSVVYCEFSAFGQTGPMAHFGANDVALQAHCGLIDITGEENGEGVRSGTSVIDLHGGVSAATAILAALLHRERTGEGQYVETSLLRSSAHLMNYFYTEYWLDGTMPPRLGTANLLSVPNQAFPTSDGSVVIIAGSDEMWQRCTQALGPDRLDLPQFKSFLDRRRNRIELVATVSEVTRSMTCDEVIKRLSDVRVNVSKVNSVGEAADHPQLAAIGGVAAFDFQGTQVKSVTTPFAMSKTPPRFDTPPPRLGADTDDVLAELGYSAAEIERFRSAGAIGPTAIA
jgi:crotonobetainyl-CoA:carnitine CoA-transferase CaiB-like acyl-CoA transferase